MKFYSRILSINCIIALVILPCHAQAVVNHGNTASIYVPKNIALENEKLTLAKNLVKIQNVNQEWQDLVLQIFKKNYAYGSAEDIATANQFTEILNKVNIEAEMTQYYAITYSLEELKLLNKFYDTPEGKAIFIKQKQLDKTFQDVFIHHIQQIMLKYGTT